MNFVKGCETLSTDLRNKWHFNRIGTFQILYFRAVSHTSHPTKVATGLKTFCLPNFYRTIDMATWSYKLIELQISDIATQKKSFVSHIYIL